MTTQKINSASTVAERKQVVESVIRDIQHSSSRLSKLYPVLKEASLEDYSQEELCVSEFLDELEHCFDFLGGALSNIIREEAHNG